MRESVNNKFSIREKLLPGDVLQYANFQYALNLNVRRDELTYLEAFAEDILRKPGS